MARQKKKVETRGPTLPRDDSPIRAEGANRRPAVRPSHILILITLIVWGIAGILYVAGQRPRSTQIADLSSPTTMTPPLKQTETTSPAVVKLPQREPKTQPTGFRLPPVPPTPVSPMPIPPLPEDPIQPELKPKISVDVEKALKSLEGEWEWTRRVAAGEIMQPKAGPRARFIFKGQRVIPTDNPNGFSTIEIDPLVKPATFDLTDSAHTIITGIYELDRDTLRLCFTTGGGPRPKELKSTQEANTELWILKKRSSETE